MSVIQIGNRTTVAMYCPIVRAFSYNASMFNFTGYHFCITTMFPC